MTFATLNKCVATAPFVAQKTATARIVSGVALIDERNTLGELKVVFDSEKFRTDDIVFIDPINAANFAWWKKVYELDGKQFILVPEEMVLVAKLQPRPYSVAGGYPYQTNGDNIILCGGETPHEPNGAR